MGQIIHSLLIEYRDELDVRWFLTQATRQRGLAEAITLNSTRTDAAAIRWQKAAHGTALAIRQRTVLLHGRLIGGYTALANSSLHAHTLGPREPRI